MVVVTTKVILGIHSVARAAKLVAFTAEDDTGRRCVKLQPIAVNDQQAVAQLWLLWHQHRSAEDR